MFMRPGLQICVVFACALLLTASEAAAKEGSKTSSATARKTSSTKAKRTRKSTKRYRKRSHWRSRYRARARAKARARRRSRTRRARAKAKARAAARRRARARARTRTSARSRATARWRSRDRRWARLRRRRIPRTTPRDTRACLRALDRLGVSYVRAKRRGVSIGVKVTSKRIGGVEYWTWGNKRLVLDCSMVYSLAKFGPTLVANGVERIVWSSGYRRSRLRKSGRWSRHAMGRALDIHVYQGKDIGKLDVALDYEQGLGDVANCLGAPLTKGGATLRNLVCKMRSSKLFHNVLDPDYDEAHYHHFHLSTKPWQVRRDR